MTVGTILMCFLHKRDPKKEEGLQESSVTFYSLMVSLSNSVINPLCDRRLLLIIPLIAYSGLQQAFVWWVFYQLTFKTFWNVLPPEILKIGLGTCNSFQMMDFKMHELSCILNSRIWMTWNWIKSKSRFFWLPKHVICLNPEFQMNFNFPNKPKGYFIRF